MQFLQAQLNQKEKFQEELLIEKIMMDDTINICNRKNELFASKLKSYEIGWEKEMKISEEKNELIMNLEIELKKNKLNFSTSQFENENLKIENIAIKDKIEENEYSILKLEERALTSEEASKEWEEKFQNLERTHAEYSLNQKEHELQHDKNQCQGDP